MKRHIALWAVLLALFAAGCGGTVAETPRNPEPAGTEEIEPPEPGEDTEEDTGDLLLSSVNASVEDGRTLRLDAIGRTQIDSGNRCGVREVRVYEDGKLIQTIQVSEAGENLDGEYALSPSVEAAMAVRDINFDGSDDLDLTGWISNSVVPHHYWIWNSGVGHFLYAITLENAVLHPDTGEVTAEYRVGRGAFYTDRYAAGTTLTLASRDLEDWDHGTEDFPLREHYEYPDGVETLVRQEFTDYDDYGRTVREIRERVDGELVPVRMEELEVADGETRVIASWEVDPTEDEIPEPEEEFPVDLPEDDIESGLTGPMDNG